MTWVDLEKKAQFDASNDAREAQQARELQIKEMNANVRALARSRYLHDSRVSLSDGRVIKVDDDVRHGWSLLKEFPLVDKMRIAGISFSDLQKGMNELYVSKKIEALRALKSSYTYIETGDLVEIDADILYYSCGLDFELPGLIKATRANRMSFENLCTIVEVFTGEDSQYEKIATPRLRESKARRYKLHQQIKGHFRYSSLEKTVSYTPNSNPSPKVLSALHELRDVFGYTIQCTIA